MFGYINFKVRILLGFLVTISLMIDIVAVGLLGFSQTQLYVARVDDTLPPNAMLAERMAVYTVQVQHLSFLLTSEWGKKPAFISYKSVTGLHAVS